MRERAVCPPRADRGRPIDVLDRRRFLLGTLSTAATFASAGVAYAKANRDTSSDDATEKKSPIRDVESSEIGKTFELGLEHAPFPDVSGKYTDDTVMVFVPSYFRLAGDKKVDFVVHFHGHNSSAKDVIGTHKLRDQLHESKQNAVLVVPQGPVAAADGDFGKLMRKGGLAKLLDEAREVLATKKASGKLGDASLRRAKGTGRVVLTSHSGGYHAAAVNVETPSVDVREVYLFDSLYDDVPTFRKWVTDDPKHHKLVSYYIGGKTLEKSVELAKDLEDDGIDVTREEGDELITRGALVKSRGVFLLGRSPHYTACCEEHPLRECLLASCLHGMGGGAWLKHRDEPRAT